MIQSGAEQFLLEVTTSTVGETVRTGEEFAGYLEQGDIVLLKGELGAGKTHFVKGVARFFGISEDEVQSPTFSLIHEYPGSPPLYHLDCYRLKRPEEALGIGLEEYLYGEGISLIEWPEKVVSLLSGNYWTVEISHKKGQKRHITIQQNA